MKRLILFFAVLLTPLLVQAQSRVYDVTLDSVQHQYVQDSKAKKLIKAGIGLPLFQQSSVSPTWKTFALDITAEHKINKAISVIGGLETQYSFSQYAQLYNLDMPLGLRYYFSLGKKMKKRDDPHNFFSYYIAVQTHNTLFSSLYYDTPNPAVQRYYRGQFLDHTTNVGKYNEALNFIQHAYFQFGSQFRMSKNNYLDINTFIPIPSLIYHKTDLTLSTPPVINVKYGISW